MNKLRYNIILFAGLAMASAAVFIIQTQIFDRPGETLFYLLQDLAFVPVQALIVTLILNNFIGMAEKRQKNKKIHVIISAFFSEAGTAIAEALSKLDASYGSLCSELDITGLDRKKTLQIRKNLGSFKFTIECRPEKLEALKEAIVCKKPFLIAMLENSNLLEHDSFTDMLWAVFHVADELETRGDPAAYSPADVQHIENDILRAYKTLISEWFDYVRYLKNDYPFLYVMAVRKNPFVRRASADES